LEADLLVAADGANSFVRHVAGIQVDDRPYAQTAVVANFDCVRPHRQTAYQWFQGGPVLALLPLPGERVSMVWSVPHEQAGRLMDLDGEGLAREVEAASKGVLGSLRTQTAAQAFPLRRIAARRMVLPHLALAGDAAHAIHPLAGQGLNLGLQDARSLGSVIMGREPVRSLGDLRLLRRYERDRSEAILAMRAGVHGLHNLFESHSPAAGLMRNIGLNLTNRLPVIKNILLRHALN
jgi:ubiquinone biosynthesis UbiH/UbiF/VisC/COQ6 family hydroxylase